MGEGGGAADRIIVNWTAKLTTKSIGRLKRDRCKLPKQSEVAAAIIHDDKLVIVTKDMLVKQLHRDGPRVAKSFDLLARKDISECSAVFARQTAMLLRYLHGVDDDGFHATAARLLFSALNSYTASVEVARHGYPRQYGATARMVVETLATVLAITTEPASLKKFNEGKLDSTKCFPAAKKCLPMIGQLYGMLSNDFVHIGRGHAVFQGPSLYKPADESLQFIISCMRALILLTDIVVDLIFGTDSGSTLYWRQEGKGWIFDPEPTTRNWMNEFAKIVEVPTVGDQ